MHTRSLRYHLSRLFFFSFEYGPRIMIFHLSVLIYFRIRNGFGDRLIATRIHNLLPIQDLHIV